jgi:hypothetical protein
MSYATIRRGLVAFSIVLLPLVLCAGCTPIGGEVHANNCINGSDPSVSSTPECILESNGDSDFFMYEGVVYLNVGNEANLDSGSYIPDRQIGEIHDTKTSGFDDWTATKLKQGTKIYTSHSKTVLLAEIDGKMIPYLKMVEG